MSLRKSERIRADIIFGKYMWSFAITCLLLLPTEFCNIVGAQMNVWTDLCRSIGNQCYSRGVPMNFYKYRDSFGRKKADLSPKRMSLSNGYFREWDLMWGKLHTSQFFWEQSPGELVSTVAEWRFNRPTKWCAVVVAFWKWFRSIRRIPFVFRRRAFPFYTKATRETLPLSPWPSKPRRDKWCPSSAIWRATCFSPGFSDFSANFDVPRTIVSRAFKKHLAFLDRECNGIQKNFAWSCMLRILMK